MWTPRYLKLLTLSTARSPRLPHIYYHLLHLVCIEGEIIFITPRHQTVHLPPVGCFILPSDAANHCIVISELQDNVILVSGDAVMGEQGAEDGAEDTSLWCASVCSYAG